MSAYYNEFDPFAAAWLRELIKDGLIADGEVDERTITEVQPGDLKGFTQCHFFAGIGGWSAAARLAGWGDDRPMWTGSPPCQPFSTAGKQKGQDDERHLWPVFFNLIRECRPSVVFGEQVAAAIRTGWFDDLQDDMEKESYATAMVVLPAGSLGAPHKRDRLWTIAERMADTNSAQCERERLSGRADEKLASPGSCSALNRSMADTHVSRRPRQGVLRQPIDSAQNGNREVNRTFDVGSLSNFWEGSKYIHCRDGKVRQVPTEPPLFPLAHGISNRVGLLRGAGNAIVPQVAAEVIKAFMEGE